MYRPAPQVAGMGSIDLSTLSWEDYLFIGIIGTFGIGIVVPSIFEPSKPRPKKRRKRASAGTGFVGGLVTAAAVAAAGYYVWTSGSQIGASLAGSTS